VVLAVADARPVPEQHVAPPAELATYLMTGVYAPPADLPLDVWVEHGRALAARYCSVCWDIADWAALGLERFGKDALPHLGAVTHRSPATVRKMAALARAFPSARRRAGVAYSLHSLVAGLPKDDADRLLDQAERERWRYHQLAAAIQARVGRRRPSRKLRPRPERTLARSIIRPGATLGGDTAVRCPGCLLPIAFIIPDRAVLFRGASTLQRLASGELVANAECACGSTALLSLAMLERPLPRAAPVGAAPTPPPSATAGLVVGAG